MIESVLDEINTMSDKTDELIAKTRKLIGALDAETKMVKEHMKRIKGILGCEEKVCSICCKGTPNHVIDSCHHIFCNKCCSKMLNTPPRKCFVCRSPVLAYFKIFSV